jgi:hypothetical protein
MAHKHFKKAMFKKMQKPKRSRKISKKCRKSMDKIVEMYRFQKRLVVE